MNDLEELGERIAEQAAHLDAAMHRLLADLHEFDRRGGWHVQGAKTCAHWLAWRVGWDLVTAREHVRVAAKLAEFPQIDDALRRGEVSYSKVRAMVRVATPANAGLLLDHARLMTASQLETLCRKYALVQRHGQDPHPLGDLQRRYVRRRDTDDGMVKIEAVLHPEEAELVWTMLDHAAAQLVRAPDRSAANDAPMTSQGAPLPDAAAAASASPAAAASLLPAAIACQINDSAESHDLEFEVRIPAPTAASHAPRASATGVPEKVETCLLGDSAESRDLALEVRLVAATVGLPAPGASMGTAENVVTRPLDDSAESPHAELPRRSLLDRLLDEADALRLAEAVHAELETPASDHSTQTTKSLVPSSHPAAERRPGVLRQRADAARRAFNRADALVSTAQQYLRGDRPERSPIEITLTIPASSLGGGPADPVEVGQMGESFVSSETARRLSCDAGIVEIVEDEHGTPLSVGRKRRTIAGALKRALRKRDTMCAYPGCTNRIFLEGHHIKHWADGGETSLDNALLLCSSHHRHVHEYGYTIELGPDQRPRFHDPRGRLIAEVPPRPTAPDLGWPRISAMNEPLEIDADTIACGWDGRPADYGAIVGHLVAADGLV